MKLNENKQLFLVVGAFALLFTGEIALGWMVSSDRTSLQEKLTRIDESQAFAEAKIAQIPRLRERALELSGIVREYTAILPSPDEVRQDAFLDDISALSQESGLLIESAGPVVVKEVSVGRNPGGAKAAVVDSTNRFQRHKYRFTMRGSFHNLHRFINRVENHKRFLQIDSISVQAFEDEDPSSWQGEVDWDAVPSEVRSLSVEISTYTYEENDLGSEGN